MPLMGSLNYEGTEKKIKMKQNSFGIEVGKKDPFQKSPNSISSFPSSRNKIEKTRRNEGVRDCTHTHGLKLDWAEWVEIMKLVITKKIIGKTEKAISDLERPRFAVQEDNCFLRQQCCPVLLWIRGRTEWENRGCYEHFAATSAKNKAHVCVTIYYQRSILWDF